MKFQKERKRKERRNNKLAERQDRRRRAAETRTPGEGPPIDYDHVDEFEDDAEATAETPEANTENNQQ